jgi:hypothetical protein
MKGRKKLPGPKKKGKLHIGPNKKFSLNYTRWDTSYKVDLPNPKLQPNPPLLQPRPKYKVEKNNEVHHRLLRVEASSRGQNSTAGDETTWGHTEEP